MSRSSRSRSFAPGAGVPPPAPGRGRHSLADKVAFLRRPETYGRRRLRVRAIETHFSWVFLAGPYAYKLKKPVLHAPMDYRTPALRQLACERETVLNTRLAPAVYLGTVRLAERDGALVIGDGERTLDWLVKMRRLPQGRTLERSLLRGTVPRRLPGALIRRLAPFYATTRRRSMSEAVYAAHLRRRIREDLRTLLASSDVDAGVVKRTAAAQLASAASRQVKARGPHVVDCHGDLRPEHVYLLDPLTIIDRLEFSAQLRALDPLEEIAFLALECRRLGGQALSRALLTRARRLARVPEDLIRFYSSRRALHRAKLAAWRVAGADSAADRGRWITRLRFYLHEAGRNARAISDAPARRRRGVYRVRTDPRRNTRSHPRPRARSNR